MAETDDFRRLLEERHKAVLDSIGGVHEQLTRMNEYQRESNGRLGTAEAKIAVLEERNPGKQGGIWGAVGGAVAGFVAGWMKQ